MTQHIENGQRTGAHAAVADETGEHVAMTHVSVDRQVGEKVCCVCGQGVSGRKRYKDTAGKYWCEECARADSLRKHPAACADCQQTFPGGDLVEYEGVRLCRDCAGKRYVAAKRAAARKAAIATEVEQDKVKRKRILIVLSVLGAIVAVGGGLWLML
ncbi:MAG: hypothetical protein ACM359_02665 [Bacillota bacterium]